jgi:hypothetical protein
LIIFFHRVFNKNIRWYDKNCSIVKFLKNNGCKMQQLNKFGVAAKDIADVINQDDIALREEYLKLSTNLCKRRPDSIAAGNR